MLLLSMPEKPSCPTHCPKCGKPGQITIERTFIGPKAVTQCSCGACGYKWQTD